MANVSYIFEKIKTIDIFTPSTYIKNELISAIEKPIDIHEKRINKEGHS